MESKIIPEGLSAKIAVVGVGGCGCNAVGEMLNQGIHGADLLIMNTDMQSIVNSAVETKIQLGENLTKGLGAGADPALGKKCALENEDEIRDALENYDMMFLACGEGGGTGTGAAPVVAKIAKDLGILIVAVVTTPFRFEGNARMKRALEGIKELSKEVDILIRVPNENLLGMTDKRVSQNDAFKMSDQVLCDNVKAVTKVITEHAAINTDFEDIKTTLKNKGTGLIGIGHGSGPDRMEVALNNAINSPLLDVSIDNATNIIFAVFGDTNNVDLAEISDASTILGDRAHPDVEFIFAQYHNDSYGEDVEIIVIAAGFDDDVTNTNTSPAIPAVETAPTPVTQPAVVRDSQVLPQNTVIDNSDVQNISDNDSQLDNNVDAERIFSSSDSNMIVDPNQSVGSESHVNTITNSGTLSAIDSSFADGDIHSAAKDDDFSIESFLID